MSECYDLHKIYKQGLERKRKQPEKKGFKVLWLPVLARNEVVKSMDIKEIIKISMSSKKMEGIIRWTRVKLSSLGFYVNINNSNIQIESLNKNQYHCGPDQRKERHDNLGPRILSRWIDRNSTSFKNCVSILYHLQNIFSFKSLHLHVNFNYMTLQFFREILAEPAIKDFEFLHLENGKIDAECLDLLMEMDHRKIDLKIKGIKVPRDYNHEKAFKFFNIIYYEARWVRIENLFSSKNTNSVYLGIHNLTYSDVHTFMKYWIESDHDMVKFLRIYTREMFRFEELFDGIVFLEGQRSGQSWYLVASNPTKRRKHQILGVRWHNNMIHLYSWGKNEQIWLDENVTADAWGPEYKVLMVLNRKKELEEELERIERLLETNEDQNMAEKKNDISRELQTVSQELDILETNLDRNMVEKKNDVSRELQTVFLDLDLDSVNLALREILLEN